MKKILIIEDERILADAYQTKLTMAGFKVFLAFDAEEGLKLTEKEMPDLILLDILLPRESGIDFLKRIKENPEIAQIPVIAFSNYDEPRAKKAALEFGVKDYLIKTDYTPREIIEKIKSYLK